ncbi:hypothetical protein [Streptomyces sp. NPDC014894]|uniref:hypothetical protein n=1 Tax=Streptomyces sp. NPDC014894 TaxID=3364931 RepID=UPI0036FADCD6
MNGTTGDNSTTANGARRLRPPLLAAIGVAGAAAIALTGCEPASDAGLSSSSVALTTDRTATSTLERLGVEVRWFSCTAKLGDGGGASASPARGADRATVDCEGETASRRPITLRGTVTDERSGDCVRGDLTARIDGETAFDADFLGACDKSGPSSRPPRATPWGERPRPAATVTVTVTRTVTAPAEARGS